MKVVVIQRRLTHYRSPLFELMKRLLAARGIELQLLVGRATPREELKRDEGALPWSVHVPTSYLFGEKICWQSFGRHLDDADLVIIPQENKMLHNLPLILRPQKFKVAYWGHGANLQSRAPRGLRETAKRYLAKKVNWWFAYTQLSAEIVESVGFPRDRITVLNNTIDTGALASEFASVDGSEQEEIRRNFGLSALYTAVFVGSLYEDKRLEFLIQSADQIRSKIQGFTLLIIGDGPERTKVCSWAKDRPWVKWVGPRFAREKAAFMSVGSVLLNPGLVGLGILDAFVSGIPLITTDCNLHSPEIAYLKNGKNGFITKNDINEFSDCVTRILLDREELAAIRVACNRSAKELTLEQMADRYVSGITAALSS